MADEGKVFYKAALTVKSVCEEEVWVSVCTHMPSHELLQTFHGDDAYCLTQNLLALLCYSQKFALF